MRRLFLLVVLTTACSRGGSDDAFHWTAQIPAGSTVHIRDGVGAITVRRAGGGMAVVNGSRQWRRGRASDIRFVVTQQGSDYYICAMWRNSGKCGASGYRGRNTSSFLSMFSLFHRGSDATAEIVAELPANVAVDSRTSIGAINIDGMSAGVAARTVNGTIRAGNIAGPIDLQTTNGDVRASIDSAGPSDAIRLVTTNGSVHAQLPGSLEGLYDLSVVNGVVHSDVALGAGGTAGIAGVTRRLSGQIGTSARTVKMHTTNGMVTLSKAGSAAAP